MGQVVTPLSSARSADPMSFEQPMGRILVVEDDPSVQKALKRMFESEGYTVEVQANGQSALESFQAAPPAVIILDLRLPKLSGGDLCKLIKAQAPSLPIVVLSATSDVSDKVLLLELGADDYVTKPFSPKELLARVRRAMRRSGSISEAPPTAPPGTQHEVLAFDEVRIDFTSMAATRGAKSLSFTAQEFKLLKYFANAPSRVISREELLNEVWGYEHYPTTRTVDNHVLRLRQKLEPDPANPRYFLTMHGSGYKFMPGDLVSTPETAKR